MQGIAEFLSFRLFISPYALVVFYYMGAVLMPVAAWLFLKRLSKRHGALQRALETGSQALVSVTDKRQRVVLVLLFLGVFLMMEVLWRMMFEFLLAFLQMRDALLLLSQGGVI